MPIGELKAWFDESVVTRKREDISLLIKSLMEEYEIDTSILPELLLPTLNGKRNRKINIIELDFKQF